MRSLVGIIVAISAGAHDGVRTSRQGPDRTLEREITFIYVNVRLDLPGGLERGGAYRI
jgi:hypothetical protein